MEFSETPSFTNRVYVFLTEDEYRELQNRLIERPKLGRLIRGSGGLRKVRVKAAGRGKQGGARIIYYWFVADNEIFFLEIYGKNEKSDLTKAQIKELRRLIETLDAVRSRRI